MMLTWPRFLQERRVAEGGNSNTERSHIESKWKQNSMQLFFLIRAFLIKLDGYRAVAFKTAGQVFLRSRNDRDFTDRCPAVPAALRRVPDETVIELHPRFAAVGRPLPHTLSLDQRRELLRTKVLSKVADPIFTLRLSIHRSISLSGQSGNRKSTD
jgi:hypothetical protein